MIRNLRIIICIASAIGVLACAGEINPGINIANHADLTQTGVSDDSAYGCGGGKLYRYIDSGAVVIDFQAELFIKDSLYKMDLRDSFVLVNVYIDKYMEDGILPSYCSDLIITSAIEPVKYRAVSGELLFKLSSYTASAELKSLKCVNQNDGKAITIQSMKFSNVKLSVGG